MELAQRDEVKLKDLLTGKEIVAPFKANQIITVPLAAWKGAILKVQ
jgi:hypothetical protein